MWTNPSCFPQVSTFKTAHDYGMADEVRIELDKMKLSASRKVPPLVVAQGSGPVVAGKIMDAVRLLRQARGVAFVPGAGGTARTPLQMDRPYERLYR